MRARIRPYWVIVAILLAGGVYAGYRAVEWPGFALGHIDVNGARSTPRGAVVREAALAPRGNIWLQNLGGARARIEALPYIRTARLHRIPPKTIAIEVTERTPDGCLIGRNGSAVIDADARVLQKGCGGRPLPRYRVAGLWVPVPGTFLHDDGLSRLQADAHALSGDGHSFASYAHDRFGDVDATLKNGVIVQLGAEGDIQEKARLVEPILREVGSRADIVAIDLRSPHTPVVRYRTATPAPTPG